MFAENQPIGTAAPSALPPLAWHKLTWLLLVLPMVGTSLAIASTADERLRAEWPRTDFTRSIVDRSEIQLGGPPRDGIPAIDNPRFVPATQTAGWISAQEPVVAVIINGEARAYPLHILMWHEIVNDSIAGTPLIVTFCPLCNAAIVFERSVGTRILDFGTTGKLRHSDLLMYDRQTESWWQQFTGTAILGELAGQQLKALPTSIVALADFVESFPGGKVLSRDTGYARDYGHNPYHAYDQIDSTPFLFRGRPDPRLPAMARVLGIVVDQQPVAYPLTSLSDANPVNTQIAGRPLVIFAQGRASSPTDAARMEWSSGVPTAAAFSRQLGNQTLHFRRHADSVVDAETGSRWDIFGRAVEGPLEGQRLNQIHAGVFFAFAWFAFNPESQLHGQPDPLQ